MSQPQENPFCQSYLRGLRQATASPKVHTPDSPLLIQGAGLPGHHGQWTGSRLGDSKDVNFCLCWRSTFKTLADHYGIFPLFWSLLEWNQALLEFSSEQALSWFLLFPVSSQLVVIPTKLLMVFYPVWTQFQYKPEIEATENGRETLLRTSLAWPLHPS